VPITTALGSTPAGDLPNQTKPNQTTDACASCLEHPVFWLFTAPCKADDLTIHGGDAKDAFAHSPAPSTPTFMKLDDAFGTGIWNAQEHCLTRTLFCRCCAHCRDTQKPHVCGKNTSVRFSRRLDSRTQRTRRTSAQVSSVVRKHCQCIKLTISLSDVVKNPRLRASMPKSESSPLHTMKRKHL